VLSEQVPTQARAQGVGFVSSVSVAIFGGTAPYLNAYLSDIGQQNLYHYYVMFLGFVAIAAGLIIRETAGVDLAEIGTSHTRADSTEIGGSNMHATELAER
jgi:MHS family alpha-ketoglutarate permease-like MFS transporter